MTNLSSSINSVDHRDGYDLFSVISGLWRQKRVLALSTAIVGGLAVFYAFTATPEYEVSTILRPAALNELDALNRSTVYSLPPEVALTRVGAALDSYDARLSFFLARPDLFKSFEVSGLTPEQAFDRFNQKSLKIVQPDTKKSNLLTNFVGLELRYPEGVRGDQILNEFVKYVIERERASISKDLSVIIRNRLTEVDMKLGAAISAYEMEKSSRIAALLEMDSLKRAELQDELKALRTELREKRESRIVQLAEAISVARSLGLKNPSTPSAMSDQSSGSGNVIRTEVNNQAIPLYFMGTNALEAEQKALRDRKSDDPFEPRIGEIRKELQLLESNRQVEVLKKRADEELFVSGVEPLRAERVRLEKINTDFQNMAIVDIDRPAVASATPVKPNRLLTIALGILVGGCIGVVLALLREMQLARRPRFPGAGHILATTKVVSDERVSVERP